MAYASLDIEWDETYGEMGKFVPELDDNVLCCSPEVHSGTVIAIAERDGTRYYMVRLDDCSVDEFSEGDVLKRKAAAA